MKKNWWKIAVVLALILVTGLVITCRERANDTTIHSVSAGNPSSDEAAGGETDSASGPDSVASAEAVGEGQLPTLLELGSDTCTPCKLMKPILEELSREYEGKLSVQFIDVGRDRESAARYRVRLIPTQVFLDKDGKEVFRHVGFFSKDQIVEKLAEMGVK